MEAAIVIIIFIVVFAIAMGVKSAGESSKRDAGVLLSFSDLHLTATHLIEGNPATGVKHPLPGLTARVEDSGTLNRRITATRLATIGVFALAAKKKQDDREVYLTIEGDTTAIVKSVQFKANPKAGLEARQFAAQLNLMAKTTVAAAAPDSDGGDAETETAEAFSVTLVSPGNKKIQVIKVVREIVPGLMLKEAKDLVEHSPSVIESATSAERAEQIRAMLAAAGAGVRVAPTAA